MLEDRRRPNCVTFSVSLGRQRSVAGCGSSALEEYDVTLGEIAPAFRALSALTGERREEAVRVLRAMIDSF